MIGRPVTEDDLHAYVDQVLDSIRQAEIEAYLADHPDVAARVEGYSRQREQLRAALRPIAEEPVPSELNLARMIEARRRHGRPAWWSAAAAAVLLCAGAAGGWSLHDAMRPPLAGGIAALAAEAADNYAVYAPDRTRPVEVRATDTPELVDWVSRRMGRLVAVPDLSASGFRLMGGRLVATPHGPAAMFMYDDDQGTRLVLLSRTMAVDRDAAMSRHSRGGVTGIAWADQGLGFSLVGPAPAEVLHPLADEIRRQVAADI